MTGQLEAVLFDVDGTLYHQPPLRAFMACELGWSSLAKGPVRASRDLRILRTFRTERERLRALGQASAPLALAQYVRAGESAGVGDAEVRALVEEWIFQRPLKYLGRVKRRGCREALSALASSGLRVGVFSDYPTAEKVAALGLTDLVSLQLCATDAEINAFKPHPAGFLEACRRWDVPPHRVAYVGDRIDVDVRGAQAAGMQPIVIGRRGADGFSGLRSFPALAPLVSGRRV